MESSTRPECSTHRPGVGASKANASMMPRTFRRHIFVSESISVEQMIGVGFHIVAEFHPTTNAADLPSDDIESTLLCLGDLLARHVISLHLYHSL